MTLDEAIKHCEEVAQENEKQFDGCPMKYDGAYANNGKSACKCAEEHRQLAEWLRELKAYKKVRRILSQNRIATDRYGEVVLWDDIKRVLGEVNADE